MRGKKMPKAFSNFTGIRSGSDGEGLLFFFFTH
jgi:hypothetical protein